AEEAVCVCMGERERNLVCLSGIMACLCPSNATGHQRRRQGQRGGVRLRLRRQRLPRIPLPSMILGNVQSLRNKVDELQ
ncbi:Autophagy-related protein 2, partial [Dissostichus eleginoides]